MKINLRQIRNEKGMTVRELSEKSGISIGHISFIENGERDPTISVLVKLATALEVDCRELYSY